jgi:hypothetical protein
MSGIRKASAFAKNRTRRSDKKRRCHRLAATFAEIVLLWLLIVATIFAFWRLQRLAVMLCQPIIPAKRFRRPLNSDLRRHAECLIRMHLP